MLRPKTKITITQQPTEAYPNRKNIYVMNFINEGEINTSWMNLTDTCKLKFPKNIYFNDQHGNYVTWAGKNLIAGDIDPLILRGDKVNVQLGYIFNDVGQDEVEVMNEEFDGFVAKVLNKTPIELWCEDRMWLLKQVKCPNKVFKASEYNLNSMLKEVCASNPKTADVAVVAGVGSTTDAEVSLGDFRTQNETIAEVLKRIQKDYGLYSYFRKTNGVYELRVGLVYYAADREQRVYQFQKNIISDQLEYKRTDDLSIGIKAFSVLNEELNVVNEDATTKKKKKRLEVFVDRNGKSLETGFSGEIVTRFYWNATTEDQLVNLAKQDLRKYYYTGMFGSFVTLGLPFAKHGDECVLRDSILTERNGSYLIKGVNKIFGVNGYHQTIQLHLRIDGVFTSKELMNGL